VLVHCAYGHGRSVAVAIAAMVEEGLAGTWEEAHARVLAVRPLARMTAAQRRLVARMVDRR
jgi:protein-tyrosine phosphatase